MLIIWGNVDRKELSKFFSEFPAGRIIMDGSRVEFTCEAEFPSVKSGDVILVLGTEYVGYLEDLKIVPKNRSVASLRATPFYYGTNIILVSYTNFAANEDPVLGTYLQADLNTALSVEKAGGYHWDTTRYKYVKTFERVVDYVERKFAETGKRVPIALDTETVGLDPYPPNVYIVTVQVTYKEGQALVVYFPCAVNDIRAKRPRFFASLEYLVTSPKVKLRGANLKYDRLWFRVKWDLSITNHKFDTTLVGSLLNENRSNSLNIHAKLYTPIGGYDDDFNKKHNKARMDLIPKPALLKYAGGDSDATFRVAEAQADIITQDHKLTTFYTKILQPSVTAFLAMEERGIHLDVAYYRDLAKRLEKEKKRITDAAWDLMHYRFQFKHADKWALTRSAITRDFLFSDGPGCCNLPSLGMTPTGDLSAAKKHLKPYLDHPQAGPYLKLLFEFNAASKTLSTFVKGFMGHIRADGLLHPTAVLHKGDWGGSDDSGTLCVTADTQIYTPHGYRTIMDLEGGDLVLTHKGRFRIVVYKHHNGYQPCLQITLESGQNLKCTKNHPIRVRIQEEYLWIDAQDIEVGMDVVVLCAVNDIELLRVEYQNICQKVFQKVDQNGTNNVLKIQYVPDSPRNIFSVSKVIKIEDIGIHSTFGITVNEDHSHITNGIVSHNTGRTAFKDPAIQVMPKHTYWAKALRRGYYAPSGYVIVVLDYSQGELRIVACVANEPHMIRAYKAGIDMHLVTGSAFAGIPLDKALKMMESKDDATRHRIEEIRFGGKAGNFGLIYGMMPPGYVEYAFDTYGVKLDLEEATYQRDKFFHENNRLPFWHTRSVNLARRFGFVRSPLGRIRHLPLINSRDRDKSSKSERMSINSPIQGTLSDMAQYALATFQAKYGNPQTCQFFIMTHDSLGAYIAIDEVDTWVPRIKHVMENLNFNPFGWEPQLKFEVDAELGFDMACMVKVPKGTRPSAMVSVAEKKAADFVLY